MKPEFGIWCLVLVSLCFTAKSSQCSQGCNVALASYFVWQTANLTVVADFLQVSDTNVILSYYKDSSGNTWIRTFSRINVPFPCDCISGEFLGHVSQYTTRPGDTYDGVAKTNYANLTTPEWLQKFNSYDPNKPFPNNSTLNVTVNCSCGK
jgi:chitin elicitor receptor kinase 1